MRTPPFVMLLPVVGWMAVMASVIAVILNLPQSAGVRLLLLMIAILAWTMARFAFETADRLKRIERWMRLSFIALHLRNERDGIQPAKDRLQQDLDYSGEIERSEQAKLYDAIGIGVVLILAGAFLHFGLFGDFGTGWAHRLFSR